MRLNDMGLFIKCSYRLLLASIMLNGVKLPNAGSPHDYPKIMLTQLLVLEHWRQTNHVSYQMMTADVAVTNEELGEISFSILGRCVQGNSCRTDFDYMSDMYQLLPLYRSLRSDILDDTKNVDSLSWRHNVNTNGDEITTTALFFKRLIRRVLSNTYHSYDGSTQSFHSANKACSHLTREVIPRVYLTDVLDKIPAMFTKINDTVNCHFLGPYVLQWPECVRVHNAADFDNSLENAITLDSSDSDEMKELEVYGPPWHECIVGHYALVRSEHQHIRGVDVYKVKEVIGSDRVDNYLDHTFKGRKLICTVANTRPSCLTRGTWNIVPGISVTEIVHNYNVIAYFTGFDGKHHVPKNAKDDVKLLIDNGEQIF